MSLRLKVYGIIALLALAGGGYYCYKTKPAWFSSVAQAKAMMPATRRGKRRQLR